MGRKDDYLELLDNAIYTAEETYDEADSAASAANQACDYADDAKANAKELIEDLKRLRSAVSCEAHDEIKTELRDTIKRELEAAGSRILAHMDDYIDNLTSDD